MAGGRRPTLLEPLQQHPEPLRARSLQHGEPGAIGEGRRFRPSTAGQNAVSASWVSAGRSRVALSQAGSVLT